MKGETIIVIHHTVQSSAAAVEKMPIGTDFPFNRCLWMFVGSPLQDSRRALVPALQPVGLKDDQLRRAWATFRYGGWAIEATLQTWHAHVEGS